MRLTYARIRNNRDLPLLVSMYTQDYVDFASRLAESIEKNCDFDYLIYRVPNVHQSISPRGNAQLEYAKPSLILQCLDNYGRHLTYLDSDLVVEEYPTLLSELFSGGYDFSVFNWLSGEDNTCYVPINEENSRHLYASSHQIRKKCHDQLVCSGPVQFWGDTKPARALLQNWLDYLKSEQGITDDAALDFAFNNQREKFIGLRCAWLPKSYARYAWWIFDKPIINHPQLPIRSGKSILHSLDRKTKRYYDEYFEDTNPAPVLEVDEFIDTKNGIIYRHKNGVVDSSRLYLGQIWI